MANVKDVVLDVFLKDWRRKILPYESTWKNTIWAAMQDGEDYWGKKVKLMGESGSHRGHFSGGDGGGGCTDK